ncbi:hypothetical protein JOF48_003003 [Arthrobacter stackebrandtii]|uniref:Transposase n=1 Tax=Arthrobacter stackebrandtii TaxID=272161 RepID=A0ABS4YZI2_9MICC|nr:hypothetical protein [Arthrobacter stackebrandtii]MBP2414204.1 hypothetical protein [Arthrobacter stackebrandtii]PYG98931.1 hypothetical protein CVV67_17825 [Arthrobacter stackebrandtii]
MEWIDETGTIVLRYSGAMRHLAIGRGHKGKRVIVRIADITTGAIPAEHTIDRNQNYQPKKKLKPLPKERELLSVMSRYISQRCLDTSKSAPGGN